jgi:cell division protein DivIC
MGYINPLWNFLSRFKYHIVIVVGVALVVFLDENSILKRVEYDFQIRDINADIAKYREQFAKDSVLLHSLNTDPRAVEKIAREHYFMKADDEDIFVLSDDEKTNEQNETAE